MVYPLQWPHMTYMNVHFVRLWHVATIATHNSGDTYTFRLVPFKFKLLILALLELSLQGFNSADCSLSLLMLGYM